MRAWRFAWGFTVISLLRMSVLAGLWLTGAALAAPAAAAALAPNRHPQREVLPGDVVPVHYELALAPDAEALSFRGHVVITVDVRAATRAVTLNAEGLTFDHAAVDGTEAAVSLDVGLGRATLALPARLTVGAHAVALEYHGKIGRSTVGFFAMDYSGSEGPRRTLATNFEPAAARQLLPCWDEPGRKATFTVTIDAPADRVAVSNMPVAATTSLSPTLNRVRFAESPKMSTYLLFVGIGDFERVHQTVDGVDVGVIVKRGDTARTHYALDEAAKLLHYYNDYFGIAYPLPKLDLIAAPGQIAGGAMENWGAIFYSQDALLFDPAHSTANDRQGVFEAVSHEMAHQWFGDLVTMAWWDDLWLNEGFARWMQTYAADDLHPEWETGLQAAAIYESGKQADAVPSTHPVVQQVYTAEQANQSFDSITYDKGAAVITMLSEYVGRGPFRDGVRRYMRAHAFGNTVDTDLWQAVQQAVDKPIVDVEQDFTRQEGVPLVRVTRASQGLRLTQGRFVDDAESLRRLPPQHWRLPLAVGRLEGGRQYVLLQGTAHLPPPLPLIINAGQRGYARVLYSSDTMAPLAAHFAQLPAADQLGLLNDARALGIAGFARASPLLSLAASLPVAANPVVWLEVVGLLAELDAQYGDTPQRTAFRGFVLSLLQPLAATLGSSGLPEESGNVEILRSALTTTIGRLGDSAAIEGARQRFAGGDGSPAEQRSALSVVAAQADAGTFDSLVARASHTDDPLQKEQLFVALSGVLDPGLARRMADLALSHEVPAGTAPELLGRLGRRHPDLVWAALAPRLDDPDLPLDKGERWRLAAAIAGFSSQSQRIADLEAYEARSVPAEARKPFLESVASIRRNQRIAAHVLPEIDRWIAARAAPAR